MMRGIVSATPKPFVNYEQQLPLYNDQTTIPTPPVLREKEGSGFWTDTVSSAHIAASESLVLSSSTMPSAVQHEDDDPVVASYDVYITKPLSKDTTAATTDASRLLVLQYPSHRPASKPYNAARSQKPTRLRLKPRTGIVEVEVPILTQEHFNAHAGEKYGQAISESRLSRVGASHGLAGGFASGSIAPQNIRLNDVPAHTEESERLLDTQTLGGKILTQCERDPVYMLGSFTDKKLYLTHLDGVVQMRPQLHHIDAEEEMNQRKFQTGAASSGKMKAGFDGSVAKLESKAIELKMKDNKDDPKDRNLNTNARLLRDIQADEWASHVWIDEDDKDSWIKAEAYTTLPSASDGSEVPLLRSMISNDDWLDKMSVPRENGKKGLRAKLKGRDRERARRKKVEHQRRMMTVDNAANEERPGLSSDSDLSSLSELSDLDVVDPSAGLVESDIKEETSSLAAAPLAVPSVPAAVPVETATRRRGRPKKS